MKHRTWFVLLAVSVVYTLVWCRDISPLYISKGGDSTIFENMGLAILQGKTPYIDIFDHKGILLYYINALGILIAPHGIGISLLSIVSTFITLSLWYKLALLFTNEKKAYIPIIIGILALTAYGDSGNTTEEWSLPFISLILLQTARNLKEGTLPHFSLGFIAGLFACAVLFLRANNAYLIATCGITLSLYSLLHKRFKVFAIFVITFIIGFALGTTLLLGTTYLFYGHEGIDGTIYGTLTFNLLYARKYAISPNYIIVSLNITLILVSATVLLLSRKDCGAYEKALVILSFCIFFLTCGQAGYAHYYICLAPLYVYLFSIAIHRLHKQSFLFIAIPFLFPGGRNFAISGKRIIDRARNADMVKPISNIHTQELDSIWSYNAPFTITTVLQRTGHTQCNRVFHHFQIDIDSTLKESIQESRPLWIALDPKGEWYAAEDSTYIKEHYEMKDYAVTHYKEKILFYRRKD